MNRVIQTSMIIFSLFFLSACGRNTHTENLAASALKNIENFVDKNNSVSPDIKTYNDLKIEGVNQENINDINYLIKKRSIRKKEGIQSAVFHYIDALDTIKKYIGNHANNPPIVENYEAIGLYGVNANNISNINRELLKKKYKDTNDRKKLQLFINSYTPDVLSPAITLKGATPFILDYGQTYNEPKAVAMDLRDGNLTNLIEISGNVDNSKLGSYIITYRVSDFSGNVSIVTREVKVVDRESPVITIKGGSPFAVNLGDSYADWGANIIDNVDKDLHIQVESNVDTSRPGTYSVHYRAEDKSGNIVEAIRTVNVLNDQPIVTLDTNHLKTITGYKNGIVGSATDNQGISMYTWKEGDKVLLSGEKKNILGYTSSVIGEHIVTLTATDEFGASGSATIHIDIIEKPKRVLFDKVPEVETKSYSRDNAKEVVRENTLGLMWQDNPEAESVVKNWDEANQYCESLSLADYTDWRLPARLELVYLVDYSQRRPSIDPSFKHVAFSSGIPQSDELSHYNPAVRYWSSNTFTNNGARACWVEFSYGILHGEEKKRKYHVRCVRNDSNQNNIIVDYARDANGIVLDKVTNLEWQDDFSDNNNKVKKGTWDQAVSYCQTFTLGGKDDWRLPNLNELRTLIDDMRKIPAQDPIFNNNPDYKSELSGTPKKKIYNWSSTVYQEDSAFSWGIYNAFGGQHPREKSKILYIRCVRG